MKKFLTTFELEVLFQRKMELVRRVYEGSELAAFELSEMENKEKEPKKEEEAAK